MEVPPAWRREGEAIVRDLQFGDFAQAMAYVNRAAHGWNRVRLTLTTHSAGGLTDNDPADGA